jgi:hypothetical protein
MRRHAIQPLVFCALLTACGGSDDPITPDSDVQNDANGGSDVVPDSTEDDAAGGDADTSDDPDSGPEDVSNDVETDAGPTDITQDSVSPDTEQDILVDADDATDAIEPSDISDVTDVTDAVDAADIADTADVTDTVDAADISATDTSDATDTVDVTDSDVVVPLTGVLRGRVTAALSLETAPISNATVRVGDVETLTDFNGEFELTGLPVGVEVTMHVDVEDPTAYFSTMTRTLTLQPDADAWQSVELLRGCGATVSTGDLNGVILLGDCGSLDSAVGLILPGGGVVNEAGERIDNVLVKMAVLPVDAAPGAASAGMNSFPGDMSAVTDEGTPTWIESFGAVEVRLYDAGTGDRLQLASGRTATLQFSAAPSAFDAIVDADLSSPTIPAWFFDEGLGAWVEEGVARLSVAPFSRRLIFTMEVSHFTWWNADRIADRTCVTGRLVDGAGAPLVNQQVGSQGVDYLGASVSMSDAAGRFSTFARASSRIDLVAGAEVLGVPVRTTLRVDTGVAGSACLDVGDVTLDLAPAQACARGRIVTPEGAPIPRAEVTAFTSRTASSIRTDETGQFCLPLPAGETASIRAIGSRDGSSYRGTIAGLVAAAGSGTCGGSTCASLGDLEIAQLGCVAGTVSFESGPASNAFVSVNTGNAVEADRSFADGFWCVEIEPSPSFDVYAAGQSFAGRQVSQLVDQDPILPGGNCGTPASCQPLNILLGNPGCLSGTVLDDAGVPVRGANIIATSLSGGRVARTTSSADGRFCAPALADDNVLVQIEYFEPGTRYSGFVTAATSTLPAVCGGSGCEDLGNVTLVAESFSTCVTGRVVDQGRPYESPVALDLGETTVAILPERTGQFCANIPVNDFVNVRDQTQRDGCVPPRQVEFSLAEADAGSCGDISSCLDIGEVDFADFCFAS